MYIQHFSNFDIFLLIISSVDPSTHLKSKSETDCENGPGERYGPFTMAAIPIGAYQPNWFMKYQHVHPGEAVEIHKDIQSNKWVLFLTIVNVLLGLLRILFGCISSSDIIKYRLSAIEW